MKINLSLIRKQLQSSHTKIFCFCSQEIWHLIGTMTGIAKRELIYAGPFGIASWLAGLIFINRKSGVKSHSTMNSTMQELKKRGIKLLVCPEGTRRNTGEIHEFKKGAFYSAILAQVPIVPCVFSSYQSFLDKKRHHFVGGKIIAKALPEISTIGLTTSDVDDLIFRTRNAMIEAFNEISKEIV